MARVDGGTHLVLLWARRQQAPGDAELGLRRGAQSSEGQQGSGVGVSWVWTPSG